MNPRSPRWHAKSVLVNSLVGLGVGILLYTVFVRVPTHLVRHTPPSVRVLRLTAPDCAISLERSAPLAGRGIRANRMNSAFPAAPDRN
jgi:hypothetical protein